MGKRSFRTQGPWIREYFQIPSAHEVPRILKCGVILKLSAVWFGGSHVDSKLRVLESDLRLGYLCKAGPPVLLGLICLIHNIPCVTYKKNHDFQTQHVFCGNCSTKLTHPHSVHGQCEFEKALLTSPESSPCATYWQGEGCPEEKP